MKLTLVKKDNNIHIIGELRSRKRDEKYISITTVDVLKWVAENHSYEIDKTVAIPSTKHLHNSINPSFLKGEWVFSLKTNEVKKTPEVKVAVKAKTPEVKVAVKTKTVENKKETNENTVSITSKVLANVSTSKRKKRSKSKQINK